MKIRNYYDFILESIIYASEDFVKILNLMKDNDVAGEILKLIGTDIKTNYNFIKTTEDPSKLAFLPDSQAVRKLSQGMSKEDLFAAASNPTTVGRLVKSILNSNKIEVSDKSLEAFGNKFKALAQLAINGDSSISVVKGTKIKYWYDGDRYAGKSRMKGTLNKSCMRHEDCQDYFDIYVYNPDVVQMIIKTNSSDELEARALLWKTTTGYYLDRVYFTEEIYDELINNWAAIKFGPMPSYSRQVPKMEIELKPHEMPDLFPYMDTFCYYYRDSSEVVAKAKLMNYDESDIDRSRLWYIQSTEGEAELQDTYYSSFQDENIPRARAVWSTQYDSWLSDDYAVYSELLSDFLPVNRAVKSNLLHSWIDEDEALEIIVDSKGTRDYCLEKSNIWFKEESTGLHYHKKLKDNFFEYNGKYYDLLNSKFVMLVKKEDRVKLKAIYNRESEYCTETDKRLLKLKTEDTPAIVTEDEYYGMYSKIIYNDTITKIKNLNASPNLIKDKLKELEEAHQYLLTNNYDYNRENFIMDKWGSYENLLKDWIECIDEDIIESVADDYPRIPLRDDTGKIHEPYMRLIISYLSDPKRSELSQIARKLADSTGQQLRFSVEYFLYLVLEETLNKAPKEIAQAINHYISKTNRFSII